MGKIYKKEKFAIILTFILLTSKYEKIPSRLEGVISTEFEAKSERNIYKGKSKIVIKITTEKYRYSSIFNLFIQKQQIKLLKNTEYILRGEAEYEGATHVFNEKNELVDSYELVNRKENIKIIGGLLKDKKLWLASNDQVLVKTKKHGLTIKLPVFYVGVYVPNFLISEESYLMKFNFSEDKRYIFIDDIKVFLGSYGTVKIRYFGRLCFKE